MKITVKTLADLKQRQEKIAMLTCYDAAFSTMLDSIGLDILLVGDSLGEVVQGQHSTIFVTIEQMCYHVEMVARTAKRAFVIGDLPFMSYANTKDTLKNAAKLMQAGAEMIKLEGGKWLAESVFQLTQRGIPVCGHLGLTPQSVHKLGGYSKQAKTPEAAEKLMQEAFILQEAGVDLLVLECIPSELAKEVSQKLTVPTIGIGSGVDTDGQVLVLYDILSLTPRKPPAFVNSFFEICSEMGMRERVVFYLQAVKGKLYP